LAQSDVVQGGMAQAITDLAIDTLHHILFSPGSPHQCL